MTNYTWTQRDIDRFWSYVDKTDGCWTWNRSLDPGGYAQIGVGGKSQKAHRASLVIAGVEVPSDMDVDHICHTRSCVRPDHLRVVTTKQNLENLRGPYKNSKTGARGVTWSKAHGKYLARVAHHGHRYTVGVFDSIEEANAAVVAKRNELYTHNDADRVTNQ